jgi:hypothetical protein
VARWRFQAPCQRQELRPLHQQRGLHQRGNGLGSGDQSNLGRLDVGGADLVTYNAAIAQYDVATPG